MSFGVVSVVNPPWLQTLSEAGIVVEYNDYKNYGDDALRQGNHALAIAQYQQALKIKPDEAGAMVNLGVAWTQAGFGARGAEILADALKKTDRALTKGIIYHNLGDFFEKQGDTEKATLCFRQALESGMEQDKRYFRLGRLYMAAGDLLKALEAFESTLACQLDLSRTYREMLFRDAEAFKDDSTHSRIIGAESARGIGEEDLARYDLEIVRQVQEGDQAVAVTHNYLGWVLIQMERFEEAEKHFAASLRIWPGNRNAQENLKILRQMKEDRRKAGADG